MSNTKKATMKTEAAEDTGFAVRTATLTYEDLDYEVSNSGMIDCDFLEAWEAAKTITSVKLLVGEENFVKFKAAGVNGKRTAFEATDFMNAVIAAVSGVTEGESSD